MMAGSKTASDTASFQSLTSHAANSTLKEDLENQAEKESVNVEQLEPKDPDIVNWDGPDDPENPMNWSSGKKLGAIGVVSLITMLSPLASTIIAPATEDVMRAFHSDSDTIGAFVTSVYLLGYCFGPLVIAPLSEIYGRAPLYNICNTLFLIWNIACAVANNMTALIIFRLLAGIAGSCPVTLGAGTIADMVPLEKRGLAMMSWIMGPLIGPAIGPLAGAYLAQAKGWRWIFWLVSIVAGAVLFGSFFFMRESYAYIILKRKTERLRKETGNPNLRSALDTGKNPKLLLKHSIVRPVKMLFLSPIVFIMSLYMATVYGYLYLLFTTFPRVFQGQYGFSNSSIGLVYLGSGVGSFIGLIFTGMISDRTVAKLTKRYGGKPKPEYRLPPMFIGAILIPIGLFLYGWTSDKKVQWIVPIIGTAFVSCGMFCIFMPITTYLVDAYTTYAASVTAAATVLRSLCGALLPLAGNSMYDALGLGWGTSLLGFIAVAFIPMPLILWNHGQRIRESKWGQVEL